MFCKVEYELNYDNYSMLHVILDLILSGLQKTFTCSKITTETLEKGLKYVQS